MSERFDVEWEGERVRGSAPGIDRAHLRRLRRGEVTPERELDLHGLTRREAQELVRRTLEGAQRQGKRCISLIHGRGLRSESGPVLKRACIGWLSRPPLARLVMAFHSAPPDRGGPGATWVLLRRERR